MPTGLDWDGTGSARRMLYWASPPAIYPMTYLWKVYQRNQLSGIGDGTRYYTTFFWGNNGTFFWDGGGSNTFYGCHPYPHPTNTSDGKWEISVAGADVITRDDGTTPTVTNNAWYSQAFYGSRQSASITNHRFYINLPSVTTLNRISYQVNDAGWADADPPSPCICVGQAPDNGTGTQSWGGYSRWEEQNAIIRGLQFYTEQLSEANIVALSAYDDDASVLAAVSSLGISSLWYLNMNPRPTDVTDKSGGAHHPTWAGSLRPTLWDNEKQVLSFVNRPMMGGGR